MHFTIDIFSEQRKGKKTVVLSLSILHPVRFRLTSKKVFFVSILTTIEFAGRISFVLQYYHMTVNYRSLSLVCYTKDIKH